MVANTNQDKIPPLAELAQASFQEIQGYIPSLSLPEVLIIGARPLDRGPRENSELRDFGRAAKEKLGALERERETILRAIIAGLYPNEKLSRHDIATYLGKHEVLSSEALAPPELLDGLEKSVKREVLNYRTSIGVYRGYSRRLPPNAEGLVHQEQTPVHLVYFFRLQYSEREPHLIGTKRKADIRIAGKIPYYMIKEYRKRQGKPEKKFTRYMALEDGIIRDIAALQFVSLGLGELARIKESITTGPHIEVLGLDDYYAKREGPYHAFHMDVVWNPKEANAGTQLFNPHVDTVEIKLMDFPCFMNYSNFGLASDWRRTIAQEAGIVQKNLKDGRLQIDKYTPEEREWRGIVRGRIMAILSYGDPAYNR